MKEFKIKVNGMVCGGCESRVKNALSTIDGVESVNADHNTGMVTVMAKEDLDVSIFEEKIEDIGFEVEKEG